MVIIDKNVYNKESPPIPVHQDRAEVHVNFNIDSIGSIDEMEMTVEVTFKLILSW